MNKYLKTLVLFLSLFFVGTAPQANALPPNYTVLADDHSTPLALPANPATLIDSRHPLHIDPSSQLPTFLWAAPVNSTVGPALKSLAHADIEQAARQQLARYAAHYQLTKTAQATAKLEHIHGISDNGYIVRLSQHVHGIEVFNSRINVLLDRSLQLIAISGHLAPKVTVAKSLFKWTAGQAIAAAFYDLHQEVLPDQQLTLHKQQGGYQWYALLTPLPVGIAHKLSKPVRIKKVLFPLAKGLEPAYYLELSTESTDADPDKAHYAYVISATQGQLLSRSNMAHDLTFTYRVWADKTTLIPYDSPYGNDKLTPLPAVLPVVPVTPIVSKLLTLSCGPISTCDPWLSATATETIGNNVDAYADLKRPNGFSTGDIHATLSAPYTFDYKYKFSVADNLIHSDQLQAAIVQAFYTTNFMHDWLYDHGFDESAGNGQHDNYQRGGKDGDRMHVEVNDFRGRNNSNMLTPRDGASATMQLFPWTHNVKSLAVNFKGQKYYFAVTTAFFGPAQFRLADKEIVLLDDGVDKNSLGGQGSLYDGCQTPPVNAADLVGAIALIDRGDCKFAEKAKIAQDAGAIAILMANNTPEPMITMMGSGNPAIDEAIFIPILGIAQDAGTGIKQALALSPITATMIHKRKANYNSALDNTLVIHEWGHFLSARLAWLDNNQGSAMGEGWSDFLALLATVKEQDRTIIGNGQFQAAYSIFQYISPSQPDFYPFGVRRYPYSTDLNKNPLTFKYIGGRVALPTGVPVSPNADITGNNNSEVHNSGEIWASMLWEAYAALLNDTARLSFSEAQNRMLDYLVASLKMTPTNPTFLEARDALLAVAKVHDLADYTLFWQAFAKRGAGIGAIAPPRYSKDHAEVVEDFQY